MTLGPCSSTSFRVTGPDGFEELSEEEASQLLIGETWTELSRQTSTVTITDSITGAEADIERIDQITFEVSTGALITMIFNNP